MGVGHPHAGGRHRWRLALSFALIAGFFVVELVTALVSGSLALLSDAGHMAADVVALGAALLATRVATRHDTTGRRTYGSYRVEVFASLLAVLLMHQPARRARPGPCGAAGPIRNRARHLAGGAPLAHRLRGDRLVMPGADDHETVCSCAAGRRTSRVSVKVSTSLPDWSIARPTRWSS